jgi:hypothetical protein
MKIAAALLLSLQVSLLVPAAALAAEEPEIVYTKFHRAIIANDLDEMLRYATDAQRAEMGAMSAAQKSAQLKMMSALMPRVFVVRDKSLAAGGQGARLVVSGAGPVMLSDKPETLYGTIRMVMQRGEWKVGEVSWSNNVPAMAQPAPKTAPQAAPAAPAEKKAAAAQVRKTPVVGSLESAPERKLGAQKPPCVYKPVMTADDLENCK